MRWALFPVLAAFAGAAGGAIAGALEGRDLLSFPTAVSTGTLSAGAAFASMLTMRAWPSLLVAPALSGSAILSGFALWELSYSGQLLSPREVFSRMSYAPEAYLLICTAAPMQAVVHRVGLRRSWPTVLAAGTGAALLLLMIGLLAASDWIEVGEFMASSTLAQVPAVLAARAVARRLRPPEAA